MLRLVLPKGSLEGPTLELFADADLTVRRNSDVDYRASIDDPRVDEVRILRPQEIPLYVADGMFDLGITGRDWVEETGADVVTIGELAYSKASPDPVRVVLCVAQGSPVQRISDLPQGTRVSTEYPELTRRALEKAGITGRREDLLWRHRGEDPRDRRRRRRHDGDREGTESRGIAGGGDAARFQDRACGQPDVGSRPDASGTR